MKPSPIDGLIEATTMQGEKVYLNGTPPSAEIPFQLFIERVEAEAFIACVNALLASLRALGAASPACGEVVDRFFDLYDAAFLQCCVECDSARGTGEGKIIVTLRPKDRLRRLVAAVGACDGDAQALEKLLSDFAHDISC